MYVGLNVKENRVDFLTLSTRYKVMMNYAEWDLMRGEVGSRMDTLTVSTYNLTLTFTFGLFVN